MKACSALWTVLSVLVYSSAALSTASRRSTFGPKNCASVSRSSAGTCVITTDCEGNDLSQTEFAFDCVGHSGIVRHSFGQGGFDTNEEFDTEVKCAGCQSVVAENVSPASSPPKRVAKLSKAEALPASAIVKAKVRQVVTSKTEAAVQSEAKTEFWPFTSGGLAEKKPDVARFGPNGCVSTWKSAEGHCIMQTNCKKEQISKYEFGLVCVDKVGSPVRHLFGKDSFDTEETFDTLIKCDKCLGLEDIPDEVALNGEVQTMSADIANLKDVMKNISVNVDMLKAEVFKGPAPAAAPAPAVAPPPPEKAMIVTHRKTHNLRLARNHEHERREDYYDDYNDDDYARDDRDERQSVAQTQEEVTATRDGEDDYDDED